MTRCLFGLALLGCNSALANPVVYSDRSEFEAALPGLPVEGFEVPFDTSSTVSFDGFIVGEDSSAAIIKSRTDYVSAGERSLGFTWNGDGNLLFSFNPPIDAFAADILDFGTCCGATFLNATNETGEWNVTAATGSDRPRGNLQFFGILSETPFSEIAFTSDVVSDNDLIVFDEIEFRAVPEPNGLTLIVLLGCGLTAIGGRSFGGRVRKS